ncbi:MAG: hemolysin family protein [Alphaproteobacteria bacterium]
MRGWLRGLKRMRNGETSLRESLEELIEEHDESQEPINPEERLMLMNVLELDQRRVDDVMVPRADIVAAREGVALDELVAIFNEASHSRLPVFRETLDDVIGMVHIKDLLGLWDKSQPLAMSELVRAVLFVPPSMPVLDLLLQMQATHIHMALVVDEYGGTDGLATIEDLVEEIVGEIEDEHDRLEAPQVVELPDGTLELDARTPIDDLEQRIGCNLLPEEGDEDVETVGGLVFSLLGRVPRRGELMSHPAGVEFEVVDADARRVKRVRVRGPGSTGDDTS